MYSQRSVVKEVGCPLDKFEPVEEAETALLVGKVDGKHGAESAAELLLGKFVERIVRQTEIVYLFHGRKSTQKFRDSLCIG